MIETAARVPPGAARRERARPRRAGRLLAAVVGVLLAIGMFYYGLWLIEHAVERIASQVTDTPVRIGAVDFEVIDRRIGLVPLLIANPSGFTAAPALRFGAVGIEVGSVSRHGPIVLDALGIVAPLVRVEIQEHARLNILVLRDQIRASARAGRPGPPPGKLGDVLADLASRAHVRVERLAIEPVRVVVDASEQGPDAPVELRLAPVELANVGGERGVTPAELTRTITLVLIENTIAAVHEADVRGSREGVPEALGAVRRSGRRLLGRSP